MTKVDTSLSLEDRKKFMQYCADKYETSGTSPISDKEYDDEYYAIQKLDPDWDIVGGMDEDHVYGTKVKHKIVCGSLLKDPNPEAFLKSIKSIYSGLDLSKLRFALQYKIDGSAMCCVYNNGKLQNVITRGRDGLHGVDVSLNGKYITGIPQTIPCKDDVEVRGECYKDRKDFYKNWSNEYANPRNFTAGAINQKNPKVTKERGLSFIAYEEVRKDFVTEEEKMKFIADNGFENLSASTKFTKRGLTFEQIARAVKIFMDRIDRKTISFDIDGIVVKLDNIAMAKSMGSVAGGKKPKSNRAVKFLCEQKETGLIGYELNVGRTGAVAIVGLLKPVTLGGAKIQRVSLSNFDNIRKKGLKIGCKVLLQKSGDIIPYIVRKTQDGTTEIKPPDVCPACGGDVAWDKNNVTVHCQNDVCIAKINRSIEHWFKKINVLGIGKGILNKLTDENELSWDGKPIIERISDMYWKLDNDRQTEHPFRKYAYLKENFGEKAFENIVESVKSVKEITLTNLVEALGIGNIGTMSKELVKIAPTIKDIDNLKVEDIVKIEKFGDIKASSFVNGWKSMRKEIDIILKYINIIEPQQDSDKLNGKSFCFTGSFSDPTRKEMQAIVENNGGKVSSVSKNLTALVWDEEISGSKVEKAKKLGIPIIAQKEFLEMLK